MTITYADRFAFLPTRCEECNRLFIFEPYYIHKRVIDNPSGPSPVIKKRVCFECEGRRKLRNDY